MYLIKNWKSGFNLGMSIAFSHGTANALLFGMNVIHIKGFWDFILWAIPNTICMAIFGWLYYKDWLRTEALNHWIVKVAMIALQISMLIFQMKLLQTYFAPILAPTIFGANASFVVATAIALVFVVWMFKKGLATSIATDNWQGWITLLSLAAAIGYCVSIDVPTYVIPSADNINWSWGVWTTAVYTSAIIADLQHWRRANVDQSRTGFYWATAIFGVLMGLIGVLGMFEIPYEVQLFLVIPVLGLATSTIDSIAVAMHECYNKIVGTTIAIVTCCLWWVFLGKDAFWVWNSQGVIRCTAAVLVILFSCLWWYNTKKANKQSI